MIPKEALLQAIEHCGTQAELARRLSTSLGREIKTGHIYHLLNNRITEDFAPAIEAACEGLVKADALCPDVQWKRDRKGNITGYFVPAKPAEPAPAPTPDQQSAAA